MKGGKEVDLSHLRPLVKPPRLIKEGRIERGLREGRGFSLGELREAGITLDLAKRLKIRVDKRRRTVHPWNVEILKKALKEVLGGTSTK